MRHRTADRRNAAGLGERVRGFFFAEEAPYGLALVRITLPLVLLVDMLRRWPFARELYSSDGATAPLWICYGYASPFPEFPGAVAVALFTLLLASLATASAGWMTRVSLAIATTLYFYFTALDSLGTLTKYTVIANHVLLLLAVSNCGAVWSFDAVRRPIPGPRFAIWPRRLMQLLLGVIYLGAAMTKIHTSSYFSGDQLMWWMVTHLNGHHPFGEWLTNFPVLLAIGAYAAIVWEILFLFLAWRGWWRVGMLAAGVGFHVSTWLTLGLDVFPCVMIATYFCFVGERDVWACAGWLKRVAARYGVAIGERAAAAERRLAPVGRLGPAAFVMSLWGIALGGAAAERALDPYQMRGADGPLALHEVDPRLAQRMLAGPEALRPQDMIFSFETGTGFFGDSLIGRKRVFEKGEELIAQCVAAPPHGDTYVECNLHTADGEIVERVGRILTRENNRLSFSYLLCDAVKPGDYELVLKLAGREVARRTFAVVGAETHATRSMETAPAVTGVLAK